jgi:hypothetical protein
MQSKVLPALPKKLKKVFHPAIGANASYSVSHSTLIPFRLCTL